MQSNLEWFKYNSNRISIKDLDGDLDISNSKWDFLFEELLTNTENFYFLGERLNYSDSELHFLVSELSEKFLCVSNDYHKILVKLKPATLLIARSRLVTLWKYYEYPAIILLQDSNEESELVRLCNSQITYEEIVRCIGRAYLLHRNFEPNVLWFEKSFDMPDLIALGGKRN